MKVQPLRVQSLSSRLEVKPLVVHRVGSSSIYGKGRVSAVRARGGMVSELRPSLPKHGRGVTTQIRRAPKQIKKKYLTDFKPFGAAREAREKVRMRRIKKRGMRWEKRELATRYVKHPETGERMVGVTRIEPPKPPKFLARQHDHSKLGAVGFAMPEKAYAKKAWQKRAVPPPPRDLIPPPP